MQVSRQCAKKGSEKEEAWAWREVKQVSHQAEATMGRFLSVKQPLQQLLSTSSLLFSVLRSGENREERRKETLAEEEVEDREEKRREKSPLVSSPVRNDIRLSTFSRQFSFLLLLLLLFSLRLLLLPFFYFSYLLQPAVSSSSVPPLIAFINNFVNLIIS